MKAVYVSRRAAERAVASARPRDGSTAAVPPAASSAANAPPRMRNCRRVVPPKSVSSLLGGLPGPPSTVTVGSGAMGATFTWQDGERTIRFGRGTIATAAELLGTGYTLLTTERAEGSAPAVVAAAGAVHHVRPGRVDEIAEELRGTVAGELL